MEIQGLERAMGVGIAGARPVLISGRSKNR